MKILFAKRAAKYYFRQYLQSRDRTARSRRQYDSGSP